MRKEVREIYKKAFVMWGRDLQLNMVIEEASEIIQAVCKFKRNPCPACLDEVIEEIVDVRIMLEQIECIFGLTRRIQAERTRKLRRLKRRLRNGYDPNK